MENSNQWDEAIDALKSVLMKTELVETTKWGGPTYTINGKNVLGIGGFKSYVGIWFFQGALLNDHQKMLVNAQEGVTKILRQWRFTSAEEIIASESLILQYVNEAIENEKAGRSIKPEKKPEITSDLFEKVVQSDANLKKAFSNFSPYKQREFLEYIESAKREETKLARLEKIKPLILNNQGLNDKYR